MTGLTIEELDSRAGLFFIMQLNWHNGDAIPSRTERPATAR